MDWQRTVIPVGIGTRADRYKGGGKYTRRGEGQKSEPVRQPRWAE